VFFVFKVTPKTRSNGRRVPGTTYLLAQIVSVQRLLGHNTKRRDRIGGIHCNIQEVSSF
jgi:hypothetical protein